MTHSGPVCKIAKKAGLKSGDNNPQRKRGDETKQHLNFPRLPVTHVETEKWNSPHPPVATWEPRVPDARTRAVNCVASLIICERKLRCGFFFFFFYGVTLRFCLRIQTKTGTGTGVRQARRGFRGSMVGLAASGVNCHGSANQSKLFLSAYKMRTEDHHN